MSEWVLDASALLALGRRSGLPVLTTDTAWTSLDLGPGVEIETLR